MNHIFMISRLASSIQSFQKGTNGKNAASHSRHFDRSEVEKSHAPNDRKAGPRPPSFRPKRSGVEKSPSLMVRAALRREISRLRVSSKRFPSAPYRHAAPLEITVMVGAPLVISTEAERSGEISLLNSPGSMEAENLRLRVPIEPCIPARAPLQMTRGSPLLSWNQNKGIKKRSPLSRASSLFMKLDSIFFSEIRICSSGKQSRNRHPLHHCRVHQHRMHIQHGAVRSSGGLR